MTDANTAAFPSEYLDPTAKTQFVQLGLSKREYFAAMAMQGMNANPDVSKHMTTAGLRPCDVRLSFAESAVDQADALIAALNKIPTP